MVIETLNGYLVLNQDKTQGFFTTDKQLAYECRKGSDSNCFDEKGNKSYAAVAFIEQAGDEDFTMHEIKVDISDV